MPDTGFRNPRWATLAVLDVRHEAQAHLSLLRSTAPGVIVAAEFVRRKR